MNGNTETEFVRRKLFDGNLVGFGHVTAKPASLDCGEIECHDANILALPLSGVFAKHDGPRRHAIATPNHAVFISAGSPYRLSFPGRIGDKCLTLRFSSAALARVLPEAMAGDGFDASAFANHALLPPAVMLERSRLMGRFAREENDPLELEEIGVGLLAASLGAARKQGSSRRRAATGVTASRRRRIECVKEAISIAPGRKWTLDELAHLAGMSACHLAHVFREQAGTSVYNYVMRTRLAGALAAVLDSGADLTTIALDAGFASHSHFTARFRAFFGMTPLELRRGASPGKAAGLRKIVTAEPVPARL